jgi:hypothetical protein
MTSRHLSRTAVVIVGLVVIAATQALFVYTDTPHALRLPLMVVVCLGAGVAVRYCSAEGEGEGTPGQDPAGHVYRRRVGSGLIVTASLCASLAEKGNYGLIVTGGLLIAAWVALIKALRLLNQS